jgi:hypothetical protein
MILYLKLGNIRSISCEWNKEFGGLPLFKRTSYHCETIVDMPYTQLIFTSGRWTPKRRAANDKQKNEKTSKYPSRTYRD